MGQESLFENYQMLLRKIDDFSLSITQRYREHLCCARGCSDCCRQELSLFPLEFFFLRYQIGSRREMRQARVDCSHDLSASRSCILLHNDGCLLYPYRPVICRTHGLPLLIRSDRGEFRDCCPKNFSQRPLQTIPASDLLELERVNILLTVINGAFAIQTNIDPTQRISLSQLFSDNLLEQKLTLSRSRILIASNKMLPEEGGRRGISRSLTFFSFYGIVGPAETVLIRRTTQGT